MLRSVSNRRESGIDSQVLLLAVACSMFVACGHMPSAVVDTKKPNGQARLKPIPPEKLSKTFVSGIYSCGRHALEGAKDRCSSFKGCEDRGAVALRAELNRKDRSLPLSVRDRVRLLVELGNLLTNSPDHLIEAASSISEALTLLTGTDDSGGETKEIRLNLMAKLAVIKMRVAELENDSEIRKIDDAHFPRANSRRYSNVGSALEAKKLFLAVLKERPDDDQLQWLLNILVMSLGEYPAGIEKPYLVPLDMLTSSVQFPRFAEVTHELGIDRRFTGAGSVAIDDFNKDGFLDIVVATKMECLGVAYFENDGRGGFVDKSRASGLENHLGVRTVFQADFDNDGDLDLYLARGGFLLPADRPRTRNTLLRNNGHGEFEDVGAIVGLTDAWNSGGSANWIDFDKDGWLDLFVCNFNRSVDLYKNVKGRFKNLAAELGISNDARCKGSAWGDVDGDGWPDLFISNYDDLPHRLFLNEEGLRFRAATNQPFLNEPKLGYSPIFVDIENDGDLDLFISTSNFNSGEYVRALKSLPSESHMPKLFTNQGGGSFIDASAEYGLNRVPMMAKGANFGDLNNDGYLDLLVGADANGLGDQTAQMAFLNRRGTGFDNITLQMGFGFPRKGNGVAFADFSNRGAQDVIQVSGGAFPGDMGHLSLFKNPGFNNHWLTLTLLGAKSNRSAIGARVRLRVQDAEGRVREIYRTVTSGGSFGSSPLRVEVGLGSARIVPELEIIWPSRTLNKQIFTNVLVDRHFVALEGEPHLKEHGKIK